MRTLVLGGRGAVGRVVVDVLREWGHDVTPAGRRAPEAGLEVDLHTGDGLVRFTEAAQNHDVVVNASGVEDPRIATALGGTAALAVASYAPRLRGVVSRAPHLGSDEWSVVAIDRSTGRRVGAWGRGQSRTTGLLTALVAVRAAEHPPTRLVTTADVLTLADVRSLPEISVAEHC